MPKAFVPLARYLHPDPPPYDDPPEVATSQTVESCAPPDYGAADAALDAFVAQIKRTRAALEDACAARIERFTCDLGAGVLGRELRLAPAEIGAIVDNALAELRSEFPLGVRVHPGDLDALRAYGLPTIPDATLRRGDVTIDVRYGSIDVSLGARFEALLDACGRT